MTRVSCKSVWRVVETGNITIETYGSLQRNKGIVEFNSMVIGSVGREGYFGLFEHISKIRKFRGEDDQLFLLLGSESSRDCCPSYVFSISRRIVSFLP